MRLILASNSPRRKEILALAGLDFACFPTDVDERWLSGETPQDYVMRLAREKARAARQRLPSHALPGSLILAADTTVALDGEALGKPLGAPQAEQMLRRLRGRSHQVYTALALERIVDGAYLAELCSTEVHMRDYSDIEMQAYISSGDPLDKAGAYAIQHTGFKPVAWLQGCHANVIGLPLCHLSRMLEAIGAPMASVPELTCQQLLGTPCVVFENYVHRK